MTDSNFPVQSEGQRIGAEAARVFNACQPNTWDALPLDGDSDYGIDFFVSIIVDTFVKQSFYLQLKGTESPKYISNGKYISKSFKTSTLNNYRSQDNIVMVAIVDLNSGQNRANRSIYYRWLDNDFFVENQSKLESQESISIRVETNQLIDIGLDVSQYLQKRTNDLVLYETLRSTLSNQGLDPTAGIKKINTALNSNPLLYGIIEQEGNLKYPWFTTDSGDCSQRLKEALDLITHNNIIDAEAILSELESGTIDLNEHENAELLLQKSYIYFRRYDYKAGIELAKQASEVTNIRRYKIAYYELLFFDESSSTNSILEQVLDDLDFSDSDERLVAAKCLVVLDRAEEVTTLFSVDDDWPLLNKLQVFSMLGDEKSFSAIKDKIDVETIENDSGRLLYYVLTGQKLYHEVIVGKEEIGSLAPVFGREEYDYEKFAECLELLRKAWALGKKLGYPVSMEQLLNESVQVYSTFNVSHELIAHMDSLYTGRVGNQAVAYCLAVLKSNIADFKGTLSLLEGISEELSPELSSLLIYTNYRLGRYPRVVELVETLEPQIKLCTEETKHRTWGIALQCSRAIFDTKTAGRLTNLLEASLDGTVHLAVADYFYKVNLNPNNKETLEIELYEKFGALNKPIEIAEQLFQTMNVTLQTSPMIIDLAERIISERRISANGYRQYIDALIIDGDWGKVEEICDNLLAKEPNDLHWSLIKSAALEHRGELEPALDVLEKTTQDDKAVIHNIAELSFRLGRVDYAENKLIALLSIEADPLRKIRALELLIFIYSSDRLKFQDKLNSAISLLGNIVNQNDEIHEGSYLMKHLLLSSSNDETERLEFQVRLSAYTAAFPNSKILTSVLTPVNTDGQEFLDQLSKLTGVTKEQEKKWADNRQRISSGDLVIPFCHLNRVLPETSDIYSSWVLSKSLPPDRLDFRFRHTRFNSDFSKGEFQRKETKIFLDTLTVIILAELEVLDGFIASMDKVYFDRDNFQNMQQASHSIMGSVCWQTAKLAFDSLSNNITKITLVNAADSMTYQRYQKTLGTGEYTFACDDQALAYTALIDEPADKVKVINSINILFYLLEIEVITHDDYFEKLGQFCSFGVHSPSLRYIDLALMLLGTGGQGGLNSAGLNNDSFRSVFDRMFEYGAHSFEQGLEILMHMFVLAYSQQYIKPTASDVMAVIDRFALRHSQVQVDNFYALWLVQFFSVINNTSGNKNLKKLLWETYVNICRSKFGKNLILTNLYKPVLEHILILESPHDVSAYQNLISVFEKESTELGQLEHMAKTMGVDSN